MRILPIILALSIVASAAMGSARMPMVKQSADEHSCCKPPTSEHEKKHEKNDCGTCLMACCRIAAAPAERVGDLLNRGELAADLVLPPMVARDLSEPTSIFHPPRA
jgi:hypothetical protein